MPLPASREKVAAVPIFTSPTYSKPRGDKTRRACSMTGAYRSSSLAEPATDRAATGKANGSRQAAITLTCGSSGWWLLW